MTPILWVSFTAAVIGITCAASVANNGHPTAGIIMASTNVVLFLVAVVATKATQHRMRSRR